MFTRLICYQGLFIERALSLSMLILTLRKVHTGLQYTWSPDCPALTTLVPMVVPFDPKILSFIKRNAAFWSYNSIPLQGPFTNVCGQYCCLFARYTDKRIPPAEFAKLFPADGSADKRALEMFREHFGPVCGTPRGGQCCKPSLLQ